MEHDPNKCRYDHRPVHETLSAEIDRLKRLNRELSEQLDRARRDTYLARVTQYHEPEPRSHTGFAIFLTSLIWLFLAIISHGMRSDHENLTAKNERGAVAVDNSPKVVADYLKTIIPLPGGGVDSQCDAGKTWVGYRNGTGRALAIVNFEVRGYLPNRVANIVEQVVDTAANPNVVHPNASLDRIVQPGDSFGECVKLDILRQYDDHPELSRATYKAKPVSFKFLDEYPAYVQDHAAKN